MKCLLQYPGTFLVKQRTHLNDTTDNVAENAKRESEQLKQGNRGENFLRCQRRLAGESKSAERSKCDQERSRGPKEEREGVENTDFPEHSEFSVVPD